MTSELIERNFSRAALSYDSHAVVQAEIGKRLIEHLKVLKTAPEHILDLGCGTGYWTKVLNRQYPKAKIQGIDISKGMIEYAQKTNPKPWFKKGIEFTVADASKLPFEDEQFDLIYSNCLLQWIDDLPKLFTELKRVLKPQGMLFFSMFGQDTLLELKQASLKCQNTSIVHNFFDMHDVGDALLASKWLDPVMSMEKLTFEYPKLSTLLKDLKHTGATNIQNRRPGLTPPSFIKALDDVYPRTLNKSLPVTWEVIYGHACKKNETKKIKLHLKT